MIGFVQEIDNLQISIFVYDSNLKLLLFSDLFTDERGHFHDTIQSNDNDETQEKTYRKYIKQ